MASNMNTLLLFVISASLVALSAAQSEGMPPCVSNLVGCAGYLNGTTTPPATCCGPLKDAAVNQTACLCNLLNNKELLKTFNVDPAQGFALAKRCSINVDASVCSKAAAPSSSNGTATTPPNSSNSTGTAGKTENSAQKASLTAINVFIILLFPLLGLITI